MTLTLATMSKYPPYVSGHAHQAFWLDRAIAAELGRPTHQVTYCGPVPAWYRDGSVIVHPVGAEGHRHISADGHLAKSAAATLVRLARDEGVNAFLALYSDPHAPIVMRAARSARLLGLPVTTAVSVEGSDITNSLANHVADGRAEVLLSEILAADVVMAVSARARELLVGVAQEVWGPRAADGLAERVVLRYPGLPHEAFAAPNPVDIAKWRAGHGIDPAQTIVSTHVRLVPEKGLDHILDIAAAARDRQDLVFVIAGDGPLAGPLAARVAAGHRARVILTGDLPPEEATVLRAASGVGLFPSFRTQAWEETFGIAPLEYQAVGTPVLTSEEPAFRESTAGPKSRLPLSAGAAVWLSEIDAVLADRPRLSGIARRFATGFTAAESAQVVLGHLSARTRQPVAR